ncbi:aromatic ring-hydroxylating oxygenase subunit alpha [Nannocystaceae bacterium ST9]
MRISDATRHELTRFDLDVPIERAHTPPASWYTSPEIAELERDALFARSWQPVARAAELREPGQYVSGCFAERPWVITRDGEGRLRGFHNVCRHKGREVVRGSGRADQLVCGYHAWSYELNGRLRKAPQMAGVEAFDREAMALVPIQVEVWGPWVFINADLDAAPLAPRLSELDARLAASRWSELEYVQRIEWTLACNWKVYVDNYLDGGYHVPHMHPTLDAQLDMANYRTELFGEFSIQSCPSASEALGQQRIGSQAIYAWMFPNFMINRYGPCLDSNLVIPQGPSRCKVVYEFYFREPQAEGAREFIAASIEQSAITQREDIEICESVQIGLASGAYDRGRYAPRIEHGEHHFHRLLAKALR